jgi:hypothetical protein
MEAFYPCQSHIVKILPAGRRSTRISKTVPRDPTIVPSGNPGLSADPFRFAPELFEYWGLVIEDLDRAGFSWFSHYSSVDLLHDRYGLEVCGIRGQADAVSISHTLSHAEDEETYEKIETLLKARTEGHPRDIAGRHDDSDAKLRAGFRKEE